MILVFLSSSTSLYRSHHCRHASVLSSNSFIIQERHVFLTIYSCIYYLPTFFLFSGFYTDSLPCGLRLHCSIHVALLYKTWMKVKQQEQNVLLPTLSFFSLEKIGWKSMGEKIHFFHSKFTCVSIRYYGLGAKNQVHFNKYIPPKCTNIALNKVNIESSLNTRLKMTFFSCVWPYVYVEFVQII